MDHWTRINAAIEGGNADRVPVALWRHFPEDDQDAGRLAARSLEWQAKWDFDLVKFMPSGTYSVEDWGAKSVYQGAANGARAVSVPGVRAPEDWRRLPRLDAKKGVLGAQNAALALAAREWGGRLPILQTVFSPLTTARKLAGDALIAQLRSDPEAVEAGLRTITDTTIDFAIRSVEAGAHGLFFATQLATHDLLTVAEYERFGVRYDLEVFRELKSRTRVNMLHVHGENIMFDLMASYPVEMINWHDRLTAPALKDALGMAKAALVGGVEERGLLVSGNERAVRTQVRDAIVQTGGRRLMVGPGCVAAIAAPEQNIRAVIDEVRTIS
jgi:uroporphyrinogen decarboxylase